MIILGVDPGLTMTGAAAYDTKTKKFLDVYPVKGIGDSVEDKCRSISDHVYAYMEQYGPDILAIEENYAAPGRARSALKQRELIGHMCARWTGEVVRVAPSEGKKALTGKGNAKKPEMVGAAMQRLDIGDLNKAAREAVADAMGVCLAAEEKPCD